VLIGAFELPRGSPKDAEEKEESVVIGFFVITRAEGAGLFLLC
jgi:hypothetical protein